MDLRALRYFIAVLEAGSLSRAAASLYIAQPALTAQIKKLEGELGTRLFDRSHAGVSPTQAGLQLYQDARRLLSDAAAMRERLQRVPQGPEGSVTVAIPFLLASLLMGPVLAGLRRSHPRIRVFVLDDLSLMVRKAMLDGRADFGVLVNTPSADGLVCEPLVREAMFLSGFDSDGDLAGLAKSTATRSRQRGSQTRSTRPRIPFATAARLPLVLQSRRFSIRQQVEAAAAALGVELNIAHEHDSTRVIRSLSMARAGFTFSPACALDTTPRNDPGWIAARVVQPELTRTYFLATPSGKALEPAAEAVRDAMLQEISRMIDCGEWEAEYLRPARTTAKPRKS